MKRTLLVVMVSVLCGWALAQAPQTAVGTPQPVPLDAVAWHDPAARIKLVLVGDSTVQNGSGWGTGFEAMLKPGIECINLAKGGRSSRSYRDEGRWSQALALKPTYIIFGFSHNDMRKDRPDLYDTLADFHANITRFIDEAREAGIKPILMTSLADRQWAEDGTFKDTPVLMPYEQMTRDIAKEEGVLLIDLTKATTAFYIEKGRKVIDADSAVTKDGKIDYTHLNHQGGTEIGRLVAEQTKAAVPELAPYIR